MLILIIIGMFISMPLLLRFPFVYQVLSWFLQPLGDIGYKSSYVEAFGAILGTFLAVAGALWTQRRIDEIAERKKIQECALIIYYDFDFAFDEIINFMYSYLLSQGKICDHIEDLDSFKKEKGKYRIYIDDNWIQNVAKLSGVLKGSEIKNIYELYGNLSTIGGILSLPEDHISEDEANSAYSIMLCMSHQTMDSTSQNIRIILTNEIKSIKGKLKEIANI